MMKWLRFYTCLIPPLHPTQREYGVKICMSTSLELFRFYCNNVAFSRLEWNAWLSNVRTLLSTQKLFHCSLQNRRWTKKYHVLHRFPKTDALSRNYFSSLYDLDLLLMANAVFLRGKFCILYEPQTVCCVLRVYRRHAKYVKHKQKELFSSTVIVSTEALNTSAPNPRSIYF